MLYIQKVTKNESYNIYWSNGSVTTTPSYESSFLRNPQEVEGFVKAGLAVVGIAFFLNAISKK
jgi:hypothetical protein